MQQPPNWQQPNTGYGPPPPPPYVPSPGPRLMQTVKRKKTNGWKIAFLILAGFLIAILSLCICTLSLARLDAAPPQPTWTTTHTFTGFQSGHTATFNAPTHWKLAWKCNPSSAGGTSFNFIAHVVNYDTGDVMYAVNEICDDTLSSGLTDVYLAGNDYIDVISQGTWTVSIEEPQ